MAVKREIWFRNLFRFAPWSIIPVHWKGWAVLIGGSILLATVGNIVMPRQPAVGAMLCGVGIIALLILIYSHTTWDQS